MTGNRPPHRTSWLDMPLGNGFFLILAVAGLRSSAWSRSMPCPTPTGVAASALAGWPSSWPPHCLAASPGHMQSRPAVIFILAAGTREDESIGNGHAARLAAAQVSGSDGVNVPCPMVSPRGGSRSSTSCGVDLLRAAGPQLGGLPRIVYPCTVDNAAGHRLGARVSPGWSCARCRRFRQEQQFMRPPRCLLDVTVRGLGHGAALQASREDLECLSDRRHLALKPADTLGKLGAVSG